MATIKQFKQEIANLVKAQKAAKNINDCSSVYYNRGRLHAMYVAYYILKHKLIGEAMNEYLAKVIKEWNHLKLKVGVVILRCIVERSISEKELIH